MENLLSTILEALAEPAVSYIGLGYDKTIGIRAGEERLDCRVEFSVLAMVGLCFGEHVHIGVCMVTLDMQHLGRSWLNSYDMVHESTLRVTMVVR